MWKLDYLDNCPTGMEVELNCINRVWCKVHPFYTNSRNSGSANLGRYIWNALKHLLGWSLVIGIVSQIQHIAVCANMSQCPISNSSIFSFQTLFDHTVLRRTALLVFWPSAVSSDRLNPSWYNLKDLGITDVWTADWTSSGYKTSSGFLITVATISQFIKMSYIILFELQTAQNN